MTARPRGPGWPAILVLAAALAAVAPGPAARASDRLRISGYAAPCLGLTYRAAARPVDRLDVGLTASEAGLRFVGRPADHWAFTIDLRIGADVFAAVTAVDVVGGDEVYVTTEQAIDNIVEEVTAAWLPLEGLRVRLGQLRVPFTSQARTHNMTLMFPDRAGPAELFLRGTDLGALLEIDAGGGRLQADLGVFNGTGLDAGEGDNKGAALTARLDLSPLGPFAHAESDLERGPFRAGFGAGVLVNPYHSYDAAGERDVGVVDLRAAASLRLAGGGFFLSAEGLLRHQQDSLTSRPVRTYGAYAQLGYVIPPGVEPAARVGWTAEDTTFDPRHTLWVEGGVNLYPSARDELPDAVKVMLHYAGEGRLSEGEWAHGATLRLQVRF